MGGAHNLVVAPTLPVELLCLAPTTAVKLAPVGGWLTALEIPCGSYQPGVGKQDRFLAACACVRETR
jgi:hypothetical protein